MDTLALFCDVARLVSGEKNWANMENIIASKEVQVERKHLLIEFRENDRGRFLRITETAHGRRNSIIVPSTGLDEFASAIAEVLTASAKPTVT